jgi:membrane-associated protease RseP (regulator of RpoE activity)
MNAPHRKLGRFQLYVAGIALQLLVTAGPLSAMKAPLATARTGADPLLGPALPSDSGEAWLGAWLSDLTSSLRQQYDVKAEKGAFLVDVVSGSPADKAGLRRHDVIIRANGRTIANADDLRDFLREAKPNQSVTFEVIRGSQKLVVSATLGRKPKRLAETLVPPKLGEDIEVFVGMAPVRTLLGIQVQDLNPDLAKYFRLKEPKGVLITSVDADGPADRAGLKAGDVIVGIDQIPIDDTEDLRTQLQKRYRPGDTVDLTVIREGSEKRFTVELGGKSNFGWFRYGPEDREFPLRIWVESELPRLEQLRDELERQRKELRDELESLRRELRSLQKQLDALRSQLEKTRQPE